ncbi:S-adenosyl-L-methionine-dependent methyltransferase [Russula earlei]|uniref:S-adenosyl-L-methionine-dependent methyltransferase n=1 Tax=Russula earlei TaxID=71964 RepID=A0ACC0UBS3_9AGAM|nr:S-adenosyl-L-methionine-dependent methyltransferase [Russula earlei]
MARVPTAPWMLSPLARVRCLPLGCTRNAASSSNATKGKHGRPHSIASEQTLKPLPPSTEHRDSLAKHYDSLPPLPPLGDWVSHFPYSSPVVRDRISIRAPASAIRIAHSFVNSETTSTGKPKVIIEAFPGPGALSRAFLTLPPSQLKRLIILEDHGPYLEYLRPLARADPRVSVIPLSGFSWDTYSSLVENGDLDVDIAPWENLHPELHFVTHIPQTILGEQLVAQLFRCIPEQSWLFKYGRIPMSFILADWVWRRISAPPKGPQRCKLSVIAEATSHFFPSLPPEKLSPFPDHFHPITNSVRSSPGFRPEARRRGSPFLAINVVPHDEQIIDKGKLDQWDYILRRLFVLKSTPLRKAISSLAPGAEVLLDRLTDKTLPPEQRVDVRLSVKQLNISDWALIARAFDAWPFAPDNLTIDSFVAYERD